MSEYQYYEFQTIDRPLTSQERESLSQLSSRVQLTATQAIFTYSYGDFPADPKTIVAQYFDAMYYVANWGTQQLIFRFPASLIDLQHIQAYCLEDCISVSQIGNFVLLELCFYDEEGLGWIEGEGELTQVIDLRNDILQQDYRLLYLAWLKALTLHEVNETESNPPLPPRLNHLSPPLTAFVELFGLDTHLVTVASKYSSEPVSITDETWFNAISQLPRKECDRILFQLLKQTPNLAVQFQQQLSQQIKPTLALSQSSPPFSQLLNAAKQEKKQAQERQRRQAEAQKIEDLKQFASQEAQAWQEIERLLLVPQAKFYDEAVKLLTKLQDLSIYQNQQPEFQRRLNRLYEQYSRRTGFLRRLRHAGLYQQ